MSTTTRKPRTRKPAEQDLNWQNFPTWREYAAEEVRRNPDLKLPATADAVVQARADGLRWERVAARTGLGPAEVRKLYEEGSGKPAAESNLRNGGRKPAAAESPARKRTARKGGKVTTRKATPAEQAKLTADKAKAQTTARRNG